MKQVFIMIFLLFSAHAAAAADEAQASKAKTNEQPNGISAEKLLAAMDPAERSYYYQSFDYAMLSVKPGQRHTWESYNSNGYFEMDAAFVRNDTVCRNFREFISLQKLYSISSEGVGCKRVGRDGWCRLKKTDMATCAMEAPQNAADSAMQAVDDVARDVKRGMTQTEKKAENSFDKWWPF